MPQIKSNKKTAAGTGSIRKVTRTSGGKTYTYWEARYTEGINPGTGKQIQRSITGKTQKEVAQKLKAATASIDTGTYTAPCRITVGEWLDTWLSEYLVNVKPRTKDSYETTVKIHLKPAIGALKLEALTTAHIQKLYNDLQRQENPLSPKTIKNLHGVLHKALQQAVDISYLRFNPATPCKLPRIEKAAIKPLDDVATKAFMQAIQGHRFEYIFLTTLFTGMREGEVLGLTWDCIDFDKGTILIGKQLQRKRDGSGEYVLVSPKNGKHRQVSPAPFVMEILKKQKLRQAVMEVNARELWLNTDFVFTDEVGKNLSPQTLYLNFKKAAAKAGYPDCRFHDLRHSYAVAALQSGDDIKTVQETLGHHTAAFTLDVYGHVTEKMKQDSANRMQQYISSLI